MYLVTGGTGFVGCYIVRDVLRANHAVAVFDLHPDLNTLGLVAGLDASERVTIVRGDITIPAQLFSAVHQFEPEVIIHLASPVPPESEVDGTSTLQRIVNGTINVFEAARMFGVRKVVWASASSSVFGRSERHDEGTPLPNDAPHYPESLYGICKSASERFAELYWERFKVDSLGIRFCQGYGPSRLGRPFWPFGDNIFEKILLGLPQRIPCGDDIVNLQYVEEMEAVMVKASRVPPTRTRVFNTTGEVLPIRRAVDLLRAFVPGARLELEPGRTGLVWRFDTSRLEEEVGFNSRVTVEEGFRRTLTTLEGWKRTGAL